MRHRVRALAGAIVRRIRRKAPVPVSAPPPAVVEGSVDYAGWLTDGILIATGWIEMEPGESLTAHASIDGQMLPLRVGYTSYSRPDVFAAQRGKVLLIHPPSAELLRRPNGQLILGTERGVLTIPFAQLKAALTDPSTALAAGLGWLDLQTRTGILNFISSFLMENRGNIDSLQANTGLLAAREVLCADLRVEDHLPRLQIDTLLAVDEKTFYLRGWMHDPESKIEQLSVISPDGQAIEIYDRLYRHRRSDVETVYAGMASSPPVGFVGLFAIAEGSRFLAGWKVQMRNAAGEVTQVLAPSVVDDVAAVRRNILQDMVLERHNNETLIRHCISPAITRLQERHGKITAQEFVSDFGKTKETPEITMMIPLYRRIDFVEQQMAQFYHDPEIGECEIIYLLDSPEMAQELAVLALQIYRLYGIPFRVVELNQNAGFSGVNNVGSSLAQGRLLLLLNSDVLPDKPGWLGKMKAFYEATPKIGALGPKLLYEDDSLQHAGLYFSRPQQSSVWGNQHYFKGLHRHLPAANVTRRVPAVTAACMMIDRSLYHKMGGLRGIYVQGDYEDSDLCLRLLEAGYESWYLPEVELYHLEGQSYLSSERQLASRYNAWLHTHLWNEQIEQAMARHK
jgi:GT2 family glycosyltransferase